MVAGLPNGFAVVSPSRITHLVNGAAMRPSPVAYQYKYIDEVLDAAVKTAKLSHNHDEEIKGAQTVVLAIFRAYNPVLGIFPTQLQGNTPSKQEYSF